MRILIIMCSLLFSKIALSDTLEAGFNFGYGYIPKSQDELGKGGYSYLGIYVGANKSRVDFGVMKDGDECNERHNRFSYSRYFNIQKQTFLWGVELLDLNRTDNSLCNIGGSVITLPLPYIGYRKIFLKSDLKMSAEITAHINRVGVSANIGF